MAIAGLRDQDRLDGASNYIIWKVRMSFLLDDFGLKTYIDAVVAVRTDPNPLKEYKKEMSRAKRLILDGVQDHVVSHTTAMILPSRCGMLSLCCIRVLLSNEICNSRRS